MTISIIIAHDDRRGDALLNRCINSIEHDQDYEIVVESKGNVSEARNNAIHRSHGDILILVDDDAVFRANCIQELFLPFIDDSVGIVGGVNIAFPEMDYLTTLSASMFSSPFFFGRSVARYTPRGNLRESDEGEIISCVMAIRRTAFDKTKGFPVDCIPCEENLLINEIQSLGYRVLYNPFAIVYHDRPSLFIPYLKKIYRYGYGRGKLMKMKKGKMRMVWSFNKNWLYYSVMFPLHCLSYLYGVLKGYFQ